MNGTVHYHQLPETIRAAVEKAIAGMTDELTDVERAAVLKGIQETGRSRLCFSCGFRIIQSMARIDGRDVGVGIHLDADDDIDTLAFIESNPPPPGKVNRFAFNLN